PHSPRPRSRPDPSAPVAGRSSPHRTPPPRAAGPRAARAAPPGPPPTPAALDATRPRPRPDPGARTVGSAPPRPPPRPRPRPGERPSCAPTQGSREPALDGPATGAVGCRTHPGPSQPMRDNGDMSDGETKTADAREMKDRGAFTRYRV